MPYKRSYFLLDATPCQKKKLVVSRWSKEPYFAVLTLHRLSWPSYVWAATRVSSSNLVYCLRFISQQLSAS
jgi:hypothetical protein